jgi:hypothetical protein
LNICKDNEIRENVNNDQTMLNEINELDLWPRSQMRSSCTNCLQILSYKDRMSSVLQWQYLFYDFHQLLFMCNQSTFFNVIWDHRKTFLLRNFVIWKWFKHQPAIVFH